jgi:Uma2 family endonuclease
MMNIAFANIAQDDPSPRPFAVADISRMIDAGILTEDERIELVRGAIIVMASKKYAHELIKSALIRELVPAASRDVHIGVEMTIQFSDDTLLEPDLALLPVSCLRESDIGFVRLNHGECLLVIEVAASSLRYDKITKAPLYAQFGVREYWVIDAHERVTWIHTGPSAEGWASVVKREPGETLTTPAVPGFSIRLDQV